jgi:hypothetical protein
MAIDVRLCTKEATLLYSPCLLRPERSKRKQGCLFVSVTRFNGMSRPWECITRDRVAGAVPGSPLASSSLRQSLPFAVRQPLLTRRATVDHDPSFLSIMTTILRGGLHTGALAIMTWGYLELENTVTDSWIRSQTVSFSCLTSGTELIDSAHSGGSLPVLNESRVLCYSPTTC